MNKVPMTVAGYENIQDELKKLITTAKAIYMPASLIKDNKLAQYSVIVIEFGAPSAFWIIS